MGWDGMEWNGMGWNGMDGWRRRWGKIFEEGMEQIDGWMQGEREI